MKTRIGFLQKALGVMEQLTDGGYDYTILIPGQQKDDSSFNSNNSLHLPDGSFFYQLDVDAASDEEIVSEAILLKKKSETVLFLFVQFFSFFRSIIFSRKITTNINKGGFQISKLGVEKQRKNYDESPFNRERNFQMIDDSLAHHSLRMHFVHAR